MKTNKAVSDPPPLSLYPRREPNIDRHATTTPPQTKKGIVCDACGVAGGKGTDRKKLRK